MTRKEEVKAQILTGLKTVLEYSSDRKTLIDSYRYSSVQLFGPLVNDPIQINTKNKELAFNRHKILKKLPPVWS